MEGRRLLEIGLGYGSLGEALARLGADYHGLDLAAGPVAMMRARLARVPGARPEQVAQGSALELPFEDASFDRRRLHRLPAPHGRPLRRHGRGAAACCGRAVGCCRDGLQPPVCPPRAAGPLLAARHRLAPRVPSAEETLRYFYDGHADGDAAPHTDFVSVAELRGLLSGFREVRVDRRSIDRLPLGPIEVSRLRLMRLGLDRLVGLDLYAVGYR